MVPLIWNISKQPRFPRSPSWIILTLRHSRSAMCILFLCWEGEMLLLFNFFWVLVVFRWSLGDSKSYHVSRTLLSILTDLNNAVFCKVSILPLISNSNNLFFLSRWGLFLVRLLLLVSPSFLPLFQFFGLSICLLFSIYLFLLCYLLEQQDPPHEKCFPLN